MVYYEHANDSRATLHFNLTDTKKVRQSK